jgi:hypothetical protein
MEIGGWKQGLDMRTLYICIYVSDYICGDTAGGCKYWRWLIDVGQVVDGPEVKVCLKLSCAVFVWSLSVCVLRLRLSGIVGYYIGVEVEPGAGRDSVREWERVRVNNEEQR